MIRNDQELLHRVDRYMFASPRHCATNKVLRTILHLFGPATWHKVVAVASRLQTAEKTRSSGPGLTSLEKVSSERTPASSDLPAKNLIRESSCSVRSAYIQVALGGSVGAQRSRVPKGARRCQHASPYFNQRMCFITRLEGGEAAQASVNLISYRHGCLSKEVSKCVTVVRNEPWRQPGRASRCKPNFPQAVLPLKGGLKVCNCRYKRMLEAARLRKQVQT